ncbi:MAG: ARPP-1 family domain-containing protein [Planctomycetota bacterium]
MTPVPAPAEMPVIADRLNALRRGDIASEGSLRIVPLAGESATEPAYVLFSDVTPDDAGKCAVEVTEVDAGGSVPELIVRNGLDVLVFIPAGQELVGAKQDRIANTDILVPAGGTVKIPVSCVEQGRWSHMSQTFRPGKFASRAMRADKTRSVERSLKSSRGHQSDQGEVWQHVQCMMAFSDTHSPTAKMGDVYDGVHENLEQARNRLRLPDDAIGFAAFNGTRFVGMDLFDRASTMRHYWNALIESYLIDWIIRGRLEVDAAPLASDSIDELMTDLAASKWTAYDAPGAGTDYRLEDDALTGSALVWEGRSILHLQVFGNAN